MSTSDENGGWTTVGSSSRRNKKKKRNMHSMRKHLTMEEGEQMGGGVGRQRLSEDNNSAPSERVIAHYTGLVESAISEVQDSMYFKSTLQALRDHMVNMDGHMQRMYVWGLGSVEQPGAVHIRYQVAMAVLLHRTYSPECSETYDPVYSRVDRLVHESYGFHVADASDGKVVATVPTLFFMPHCEACLTAHLLRRNIESDTLHNVIMLGNSLKTYKERGEMGIRREDEHVAYLVATCVPRVREIALPEYGFPVSGAFNDLSLHMFSKE
ncbi:hypothetical protein M9434_007123 [Picochlorum sp. BPE23]|nr:hypothetical protein M9434_007123 [Picochlorum sp. BPE23]